MPDPAAPNYQCPVCTGDTALYDVVDFNKSCAEGSGTYLPLVGTPIYYRRCKECAFTYAPEFAEWAPTDFLNHIYNEDYIVVDPDYVSTRPIANATVLHNVLGEDRQHIRHLDYGGGNGILSAALVEEGWNSTSFDPFPSNETRIAELGKFNLITAYEVFEHVPDVQGLVDNLSALMADECLILFSTLTTDAHLAPHGRLNWWYAAPRNGHISLFSKNSLSYLAASRGMNFASFSDGVHCYFNKVPAWAKKLLPAG